jgi:hypothetical protein
MLNIPILASSFRVFSPGWTRLATTPVSRNREAEPEHAYAGLISQVRHKIISVLETKRSGRERAHEGSNIGTVVTFMKITTVPVPIR